MHDITACGRGLISWFLDNGPKEMQYATVSSTSQCERAGGEINLMGKAFNSLLK